MVCCLNEPTVMPHPTQSAVINPEADRRLGRIALSYGAIVLTLLLATTFAMPYLNARFAVPIVWKAVLNGASLLIVLLPFYAGIYRLFAARLEIGRERVQARAWNEAAAALEPFNAPLQRFLDGSGEAHYLLALAYAGLGEKAKAEKMREFVRRKTGSPWAAKLQTPSGPAISKINSKLTSGQEKRPPPPKGKPRRRF